MRSYIKNNKSSLNTKTCVRGKSIIENYLRSGLMPPSFTTLVFLKKVTTLKIHISFLLYFYKVMSIYLCLIYNLHVFTVFKDYFVN